MARKALKRTEEAMPRLPVPTLSMEYLKINTATREAETETKAKTRRCISEVTPKVERIKTIGIKTRTGCRREENSVPANPAKDVTDKTSNRSMRAPLKPKKKNLIQRCGAPRRAVIKAPRRSTANQIREEKKDSPKQRLKLKIRSCFIEV